MPTSYTSLIGLALPVTGELSGTWGDVVNNYITNYLDSAVAGTQTISGTQTAVTLSVTNGSSLVTAGSGATGSAQFQIINCTGNPAGLLTITAPASSRQYIIINATSTSQSVKIVGTGPTTGVTLIAGEKAHVAWNGSDFVKIATQSGNGSFVDLTVSGSMTLSGGTANGVLYLNGSKVATSGSALTFDGTNFATTGTATATRFIPSGSTVATNGLYLPAANSIGISTNSTNAIYIDSSQNVGVGVTPSAWGTSGTVLKAINLAGTPNFVAGGSGFNGFFAGSNAYFDGTNWKYVNTNGAAYYNIASGSHAWYTAGSGTAGTTISFTQAMTLDSSGNLAIGNTSASYKLDVTGPDNSGNAGFGVFSANRTASVVLSYSKIEASSNSGGFAVNALGANALTFSTNGSERARIDSSGNLGLGVTPSGWGSSPTAIEIGGTDSAAAYVAFNSTATSQGYNYWNMYYNGTNNIVKTSGTYPAYFGLNSSGQFVWGVSSSTQTAGNTVSTTQAMTLDASGNLLLGTTTTTNNLRLNQSLAVVKAGSNTYAGMGITGYAGTTGGARPLIDFNRSRGTTDGSMTVLANGDYLGSIIFRGSDGTSFQDSAMISAEVDGTPGASDMPGRLTFWTSPDGSASVTERARITSGGYFKASNDGTYISSTGSYHEFRQTASAPGAYVNATNASYADAAFVSRVTRAATSAYIFLYCESSGGSDAEFNLRGDGNAYADGTWNNNGADYAEYFESATGGALTVGATVVLDGNKVREATDQDPVSAIMGVVRPKEPSKASMVVGNTAWNKWANKYLTDDFDRYIMEDHDVVEWIDEEGKQHSYEFHKIPTGVTVPVDAVVKTHDDKGKKFQHYKLNPAWNPDAEYVNRENRPEWIIVGLVGQVKVLKGQPVNDRWIKMRDVSATVEEWMIR